MTDAGLPDPARGDVGLVVAAARGTDGPEQQLAVAEEIVAAWARDPRPDGRLSASCFVSLDGRRVLTYVQWSSADAYHEHARAEGEVHGAVEYRLYRSGVRPDPPPTGCVVVVSVEFDGPDPARAERWVDTVFAALAAEPEPVPGGISAYFHVSLDGARVLNYAEWTDEGAHRAAIERSGQGTVGSGRKWQAVKAFPGVLAGGFVRYRYCGGIG